METSGEHNDIHMMHILRLQMSEFCEVSSPYLHGVWIESSVVHFGVTLFY